MRLRLNDLLVGAITGFFAAMVAAALETFFMLERVFSLGHAGGWPGSRLFFIAIAGAIVGGIVGFIIGGLFKPRASTAR